MEHRILGRTGFNVSVLGLGASEIGSSSVENVDRLLNSALDAGLNVIDTGECYGESEELIGRTVAHRRSEYFLFTKCGHTSGLEGRDWEPSMLSHSIDRSLKRLKTDCLDLIQLHSCDEGKLKAAQGIMVLLRAKDAGKTRCIGYSGDGAAAKYAVDCKVFDTLQTTMNIADQESITLTLPSARANGMGVIAKRPVANVAWHNGDKPPTWDYGQSYWERLQKLTYDWLDAGDMDKSVSIALRYVLEQTGVHTAIVGTQNPDRWKQNAALVEEGPLPMEMVERIRARWQEVAGPDWVGLT